MATMGVLVEPGPPAAALANVMEAEEMTWMIIAHKYAMKAESSMVGRFCNGDRE